MFVPEKRPPCRKFDESAAPYSRALARAPGSVYAEGAGTRGEPARRHRPLFILKLIPLLALVFGVLFAWRAWRQLPALAVLSAVLAGAFGLFMLAKNPYLAVTGIVVAIALVTHLSRPRL